MKRIEDYKPLELLTEGKTKKLYQSKSQKGYILEFKNDLTAGNGEKHDKMEGKGLLNAKISAELMRFLGKKGVNTHFQAFIPPRYHLVKKLEMIPLECVGRNLAYGSLLDRVPLFNEGDRINPPVVEFFYKSDELGDPFLNLSHIISLSLLQSKHAEKLRDVTMKIGKLLRNFFDGRNLILVDYKIECGFDSDGKLLVGDEINGDSMRIWDKKTWEKQKKIKMIDKQVYREGQSLEEVKNVYQELYRRITGN